MSSSGKYEKVEKEVNEKPKIRILERTTPIIDLNIDIPHWLRILIGFLLYFLLEYLN